MADGRAGSAGWLTAHGLACMFQGGLLQVFGRLDGEQITTFMEDGRLVGGVLRRIVAGQRASSSKVLARPYWIMRRKNTSRSKCSPRILSIQAKVRSSREKASCISGMGGSLPCSAMP